MERFGRQDFDESRTLLRSARNQFYTILPLISDRGSTKTLVLVISDLLEQFVNTLTADYKYSLRIGRTYRNKFQFRNLQIRKLILNF